MMKNMANHTILDPIMYVITFLLVSSSLGSESQEWNTEYSLVDILINNYYKVCLS
jgi:hypothetical protein